MQYDVVKSVFDLVVFIIMWDMGFISVCVTVCLKGGTSINYHNGKGDFNMYCIVKKVDTQLGKQNELVENRGKEGKNLNWLTAVC